MKTIAATLIVLASLASCSRVPKQADAALTPAACPDPSYVDVARVFREADAAKTAAKLWNATWAPRQNDAMKALVDAKKLKGAAREKAVEDAQATYQKSLSDAGDDQKASNQKVLASMDAAAKKLRDTRGILVLREVPAAGGQDVTPDIIALMNQGTPEAVAERQALRAENEALKKQLAAKKP